MSRRWTLAVAVWLAVTACTGGDGSAASSPVEDSRLLILTEAGDVATLRPDGSEVVTLTDNADDGVVHLQPTFSRDGTRVAFTEVDPGAAAPAIVVDDAGGGAAARFPAPFSPFYYSWSPDPDRLAFLGSPAAGVIALGIIHVDRRALDVVDRGQPYYFDWSPDGASLVVHVGADRLDVLDLQGRATPLSERPGRFLAPEWSKAGMVVVVTSEAGMVTAGAALVAQTAGSQRLVVLDAQGEVVREVATIDGSSAFSLSPEGDRLAYTQMADQVRRVMVADLEGGDPVAVSEESVLAFAWSPDGSRLLLLGLGAGEDDSPIVPRVWDGDGTFELPGFRPTPDFLTEYLPFWDQYLRSITLWAPDGSAFTYAAVTAQGPAVFVQPAEAGASPRRVADGRLSTWSSG